MLARWAGKLFIFGDGAQALSLCGMLWRTWVDAAHSRSGDEVVARKFSAEGIAAGGRVCDSTDLGGWARNGNLFVGLFKKDLRVNT